MFWFFPSFTIAKCLISFQGLCQKLISFLSNMDALKEEYTLLEDNTRWASEALPTASGDISGGLPCLPDSTYPHLRLDELTRLTRVGPDLIRYRRPHIAAMHTTRCTVSDMPRLRMMGKGSPLPYRLLITLSPSQRSLSPRSRRNQVLRQLWVVWQYFIFINRFSRHSLWKKGRCGTNIANKNNHRAPRDTPYPNPFKVTVYNIYFVSRFWGKSLNIKC